MTDTRDTDAVADTLVRIVDAIAATRGVDPLELDPPLERVIDIDAVERLVERDALLHLEFEYDGLVVTVDANGNVSVDRHHADIPMPSA